MKKSLIALLLVVALVITVSVFAVSAEDPNPFEGKTTEIVTARCEGCNADVQWSPLGTNLTAALTNGHWYLADNTNTTAHTGRSSGTLCLELNGFSYNRTNSGHPFGNSGTAILNIQDSSTAKTGKITTIGGSVYCVQQTGGTVNQYGGTLTRTAVGSASSDAASGSQGGAISMTGGTFNMYGGKISGSSGNRGGAIYVSGSSAKAVIDGGVIENCFAHNRAGGIFVGSSATLEFKSGAIRNCYVASTYTTPFGGNIYVENATAIISGGIIENGGVRFTGATYAASASQQGGNICIRGNTGSVTVKPGAMIQNGSALYGGNICNENGILTVEGGVIKDGISTATSSLAGGNIALKSAASATISGGTISGGTMPNNHGSSIGGGNICAINTSKLTIDGGTISGGNAADSLGGNIYWTSTGKLTINGGSITAGTALRVTSGNYNGNGGNICIVAGTLEMNGGTISGGLTGNNAQHAGNIYAKACTVDINGGNVTGGKCGSYGGNLYVYGVQLTIDADEGKTISITNGKAAAGGNIYIREDAAHTSAFSTITGPDVTISGGDATGNNGTDNVTKAQCGSQIMVFGFAAANPCTLTLTDVHIDSNEVHTDEIALYENAVLEVGGGATVDCAYLADLSNKVLVKEGFTGELYVRWLSEAISSAVLPGAQTDPTLWQEAGYTGTGEVYAIDSNTSGKILIDAGDAEGTDNKFVVAGFAGGKVDTEGNLVLTPIADLTTASAYDFVRPYFNDPITLVGDLTLDLNNSTLHVNTNGHKLSMIEMRTDTFADAGDATEGYAKGGYITVDNAANINTVVREKATGNQYITVPVGQTEDGLTKYAAHRVQVDIDSVSIKPASASLYYTTNMDTNPTASQFACSYGVVLSLVAMPDADFTAGENGEVYTRHDFAEFTDGARVEVKGANSALLTGILAQDAPEGRNKAWGEELVYANAYVCFEINGVEHYVMADKTYALSLLAILKIVDETDPSNASVLKMYETWKDPMEAWALDGHLARIKAAYDEANS